MDTSFSQTSHKFWIPVSHLRNTGQSYSVVLGFYSKGKIKKNPACSLCDDHSKYLSFAFSWGLFFSVTVIYMHILSINIKTVEHCSLSSGIIFLFYLFTAHTSQGQSNISSTQHFNNLFITLQDILLSASSYFIAYKTSSINTIFLTVFFPWHTQQKCFQRMHPKQCSETKICKMLLLCSLSLNQFDQTMAWSHFLNWSSE